MLAMVAFIIIMMQLCEKITKFVGNKIIRCLLPVFYREMAFGKYFDLNAVISLQNRGSLDNPPKVLCTNIIIVSAHYYCCFRSAQ